MHNLAHVLGALLAIVGAPLAVFGIAMTISLSGDEVSDVAPPAEAIGCLAVVAGVAMFVGAVLLWRFV